MIPVPENILEIFHQAYAGSPNTMFARFGGGFEDSDGTVYRMGERGDDRLLKVLHYGGSEAQNILLHLTTRIKFIDYLRQHGVPVIELLPSLTGDLYEFHKDSSGC